MLRSGLATQPEALAAIGCVVTFLIAPASLTRYKYAAFLTLVTFHSLILCQYRHSPFLLQLFMKAGCSVHALSARCRTHCYSVLVPARRANRNHKAPSSDILVKPCHVCCGVRCAEL